MRAYLVNMRKSRKHCQWLQKCWVKWTIRATKPTELKELKKERLVKLHYQYRISQAFDSLSSENHDELLDMFGSQAKRQELLLQSACCRHIQAAWRGHNARQRLLNLAASDARCSIHLAHKAWRIRPLKLSMKSVTHKEEHINTCSWTAATANDIPHPPPPKEEALTRRQRSVILQKAASMSEPSVLPLTLTRRRLHRTSISTKLSAKIYQPTPFTRRFSVKPIRSARPQTRSVQTAQANAQRQTQLPAMKHKVSMCAAVPGTDRGSYVRSHRLDRGSYSSQPSTNTSKRTPRRPATRR